MGKYNNHQFQLVHEESSIAWKKNCILCGHVSNHDICDMCVDTARTYYDQLTAYLSENPKATIIEIYGETGIPLKIIKAFIDLDWVEAALEDEEARLKAAEVLKAAHH